MWNGCLSLLLVFAIAIPRAAAAELEEIDGPLSPPTTAADSVRIYRLDEILVSAPGLGVVAEPGRTEVAGEALDRKDGGSIEKLASLVPATEVGVNSRGEAMFRLRGASERQIVLLRDGVPLNLPWDERIDLSLIPSEAIGEVRVVRGSSGVLDGPNALAGVIHLLSRNLREDGQSTRLTVQGGEVQAGRAEFLHQFRKRDWSFLGSVSHRHRDATLLPSSYKAEGNQPTSRSRLNSALRENSLLMRMTRSFPRRGRLAFSVSGTDAEKGVPPETNRGQKARFWRLPLWQRMLLSLQGDLLTGGVHALRIDGGLSLDLVREELQPYPDSTYAAPANRLDSWLEKRRDRTGTARLRVTRLMGKQSQLAGAFSLRSGTHHEKIGDSGEETYAQRLASLALQWEGLVTDGWSLRTGLGIDRSETPRTGGLPARDPDAAPVIDLRVTKSFADATQLHLKAGRRTRFPSLRELYSIAGGKFELNPELGPETQDSIELGGGFEKARGGMSVDLFAQWMSDGIIRVVLPNGKYQRRNETSIRTVGMELSGSYHPHAGLRVDAHHTFLSARAKADGSYRLPVDGQAETISTFSVSWTRPFANPSYGVAKAILEGEFTGRRWSLDGKTGDLTRLSPTAVYNTRFSWLLTPADRSVERLELFLRVDNVTDRIVYSQVGLPEEGRQLTGGMRIEF